MQEQKKSHLAVLFLTVFLYLVGFGVIIPILPVLSRDFGASAFEVGLLMSLYSLMQFLFAPFWGRLSDRYGRRPILVGCLLGEGFTYLLFAFSHDLMWLFLARGLAGFFGASISTASASISDVTGPKERSKGMALIGAAFGLGFIVGPALGGGITHLGESIYGDVQKGIQLTLFFVSGLCFATFIFAWFALKESLAVEKRRTGPRESRWKRLGATLRTPVVSALVTTFFLSTFAMAAMESTLILLVADLFQWGLVEISFGFAYIGVLSTLNQGVLVRRLLPKWGERKMLTIGLVFMAVCFALIAVSSTIWMLAIAMTFLSFGTSFTNPSIMGSVSLLSKDTEQGEAMGTTQAAASLGRILGPALGGFLYGAVSRPAPFLLGAVSVCLALLLVRANWARLPSSAKNS